MFKNAELVTRYPYKKLIRIFASAENLELVDSLQFFHWVNHRGLNTSGHLDGGRGCTNQGDISPWYQPLPQGPRSTFLIGGGLKRSAVPKGVWGPSPQKNFL